MPKRRQVAAVDRTDGARRMLASAIRYATGAAELSEQRFYGKADDLRMKDFGSSANVLFLLAFEILLKAVVLLERGSFAASHNYQLLWSELSKATQESIRHKAVERVGGCNHCFTEDTLEGIQSAFHKVRYDFEPNLHYTAAENRKRGEVWVEKGAPLEDADFRTYAEELTPMSFALADHLCSALKAECPNLYRLF